MRPSLRLVIGGLCAVVVLVVAVITLAITYTVSLSTVRDIGKKHALALATTARFQTENYFDLPVLHQEALAGVLKQSDAKLPSEYPDQTDETLHYKHWYTLSALARAADYRYKAFGFIYDDGSGCSASIINETNFFMVSRFVHEWPNGGNMTMYRRAINITTGLDVDPAIVRRSVLNIDARFAAYETAQLLIGGSANGMWYPVTLYVIADLDPDFVLPVVKPIYNETNDFLGLTTAIVPLFRINAFLQQVRGTPNTEVFAVESDGFIVGSTHSEPYFDLGPTTSTSPVLDPGCTSNADSAVPGEAMWIGCRKRAQHFAAYPPLQAIALGDAAFMTSSSAQVKSTDVNGDKYFVVSTPVNNAYRFFGLNIVLCMPESDILGDIVQGRNTAIGVTVGVFVAAALLSFGLVYALLQPLSDVSRRMLDTARLKETEDDREYSSLAEIQDLQKAYTNMNTAIKSFTRYVPRDVVKDLMASGQLCEIKMAPLMCTMLFVDIAGFTTVCERVPPDALSALVSQYFDRASRIVMEHDGLIDKFIGDCIMAVWGAPFGVSNQEVKATLAGKLLDRETMVEPLSTAWDEAGELLRVRVGVSTGEVLAGNMGSADRMNYTVIGDPVNLAARLESLNKQFDTRVMVSEMTAEGLGGVFVLRLLMPIAVVGKDRPVKAYEVLGLARDLRPADIIIMDEQEFKIDGTASDGSESFGRSVSRVSDSQSQMSGSALSGSTRGRHVRRSKRAASKMVRDAAVRTATQQYPLAVSADDALFAQQHTKAVFLYTKGQFADAIAALDGLEKSPCMTRDKGGRGDFRPERSVTLVRELCEKYLREGAPVGFDGTFKALEK